MEERFFGEGRKFLAPGAGSMNASLRQTRRGRWCFHTLQRGIAPANHFFVPGMLELKRVGRTSDPGMRLHPAPVALAV